MTCMFLRVVQRMIQVLVLSSSELTTPSAALWMNLHDCRRQELFIPIMTGDVNL
jgi:hypothetical protein